MPELPEVETVVQGLRPTWESNTFLHVAVNRPNLRWPFPVDFAENLTGRYIIRVYRRAKYILVDLDDGHTLLIHLGMTGRMLIQGKAPNVFTHTVIPRDKHDHVVFSFKNKAKTIYNDVRRFGAMDLFKQDSKHYLLDGLGHEPLADDFTPDVLQQYLVLRRTAIKTVLLDQRYVVGLGNIYVCEALFRSGIHPKQPANTLVFAQIEKLYDAIRSVLAEAIQAGGSSLKDYRQSNGDMGYFQHNFAVYGREGEACSVCKTNIQRIVQAGRSTFMCSGCQSAHAG